MAKFCTQCGNELDENAVICPKCGTNFGQMPIATENKLNGMAIAGFICSFFVPLLGLIFSIIGLNKAKQTEEKKGLAIAGIIISVLSMIISIVVILFITATVVSETIDETKNAISEENVQKAIDEFQESVDEGDLQEAIDEFQDSINDYKKETTTE